MAIIKKSDWPSLANGSWLSDFFDNDRFFDDWSRRPSVPAVNVRETEKGYSIDVAAPGMSKEDFDISVEKRVLTISSQKKDEKTEKEQNGYTRREFSYSSFSRSFALPEEVSDEDVKATYKDGVLRIELAKTPEKQLRRRKAIEVS